ncbi:MAG: FUSC family protein [Clostridiales bacterium]|jgi:uncharacterized membrane protein YgaE (UPF0421/DUF939 family)|nr:FUSC family protein [Clostridiales bacterium]
MPKTTKIKVGLRIIKTSIAAFICFLLSYFREIYNPFYSVISAILCMQKDIKGSKEVSINRILGTLMGGVYGLLILLAFNYSPFNIHKLVEYFINSLALIPLIFITVKIKRPDTTELACVVFLSIVISYRGNTADTALLYAINRMIDTIIGIMVSLLINWIPFLNKQHLPKNKENTET